MAGVNPQASRASPLALKTGEIPRSHNSNNNLDSRLQFSRPSLSGSIKALGGSSKFASRAGKGKSVEDRSARYHYDYNDMASSFLQFCAFCEKQIVVPNNAILYCSESCRRKDGQKPALATSSSCSSIYFTFPIYYSSITTRNIVEPRQPSTWTSITSICPVIHSAKADLDPTEWKPEETDVFHPKPPDELPARPPCRSSSSEAHLYLTQFYGPSDGPGSVSRRRPGLPPRSITSAIMMARTPTAQTATTATTAPSLSHTPTTTSATSRDSSRVGTPDDTDALITPIMTSVPRNQILAPKKVTSSSDTIIHHSFFTLPHNTTPKPRTAFTQSVPSMGIGKRASHHRHSASAEGVDDGLVYEKAPLVALCEIRPHGGNQLKNLGLRLESGKPEM